MHQFEEEAELMDILTEGGVGVQKNMFGLCIDGNNNKVL